MRIEFTTTGARYERYPWHLMQEVGDYFDIPADVAQQRGMTISNCALSRTRRTGEVIRCTTLASGAIRVMLVDFCADAAAVPAALPPTMRATL